MLKTLFAISTVALFALLWASIKIAQHVRRARRRRRAQAHPETQFAEKPGEAEPDAKIVEDRVSVPPPPIPFANPDGRANWAYFNKDLGDLRDPYQGPRNRPKDQSAQ